MWFLVVYKDDTDNMAFKKVNKSTLFNKFDFGVYADRVIQFTQEAGIGDCIQILNCLVIRTR